MNRYFGYYDAIQASLPRKRSFGSSRNLEERLRDEPKERLQGRQMQANLTKLTTS